MAALRPSPVALEHIGEGHDELERLHSSIHRRSLIARVAAEATPRRARGKVQKYERTAVRKMEQRAASDGADPPRVAKARQDQAVAATAAYVPQPEPWETRAIVRQTRVRADYRRAAEILDASDDPADRALAEQTRWFVAQMPDPATRTRETAINISRVELDPVKPTSVPRRQPRERDRER